MKTRRILKTLCAALLVATLGVGIAGTARAGVFRRWLVSQNLTGSKPAAACNLGEPTNYGGGKYLTTGFPLSGISSFYVCIYPTAGNSLSGAGTLKAYFYDPDMTQLTAANRWTREYAADLTITTAAATDEPICFTSSNFPTSAKSSGGYGCAYYVTSGVTVSAGATVTTTITGVP